MFKRLRLAWQTAIAFLFMTMAAHAQDTASLYSRVYNFPDKFFNAIHRKSQSLEDKLAASTEKYLRKLERRERRLQKQLARKDSTAATAIFGNTTATYQRLHAGLTDTGTLERPLQQLYSNRLDSMKSAFGFLQTNNLLSKMPAAQAKLKGALAEYGQLQQKLNQTDAIRKQIAERQQYLQSRLQSLGMSRQLKKYKQEVYYYREQLDAYKRTLEDPQKLEAKLLSVVRQLPAFRHFFNKYSQLGSLFQLPGGDDAGSMNLTGMQTRSMIMDQLGGRFGPGNGMQQAMSQGMSDAASGMKKIKERINQLGSNGADMEDMPDFKPNAEKSKSFLKRIEIGSNMQSVKSSYFFPTSSDIGLSIGYKLSSKSTAGVGASYKVGWGRDIRHIQMSHQGLGLRSFVDIKFKGNLWITGGGELNYLSAFKKFDVLKDFSPWQKSALAGISKKTKLKKMSGNIQLLYDFLHGRQTPVTQPLVFRVGYSLK